MHNALITYRTSLLALSLVILFGGSSCTLNTVRGTGAPLERSFTVSVADPTGLSGIRMEGSGELVVRQGNAFSITATDHPNLLDLLETVKEGTVLHIRFKGDKSVSNSRLHVKVSLPTLQSLDLAGSHTTDIYGAFHADTLEADLSGSNKVTVHDSARYAGLNLSMSGSSTWNGYPLRAGDAMVDLNGSNRAMLTATGRLTGSANGSTVLHYRGAPKKVDVQTAGSVDVAAE